MISPVLIYILAGAGALYLLVFFGLMRIKFFNKARQEYLSYYRKPIDEIARGNAMKAFFVWRAINIIIYIIMVAILIGGFFAWQYFGAQKQKTKSPEQQKAQDEIAGWQAYRNEQYGFEIKYPKDDDKKIMISDSGSGVLISTTEERDCRGGGCPTSMYLAPIYTKLDLNNPIEEIIKDRFVLKEFKEFQITEEESHRNVDYIKRINFGNNIQGYLLHEWAQATGICHYIAKEGNRSINIERTKVGLTSLNCNNDYMFNQILSTFRFLE